MAHLEFGSFGFEFDHPSNLFQNLRNSLEQKKIAAAEKIDEARKEEKRSEYSENELEDLISDDDESGIERAWLTDMQRFFDLFEDRKLALDIFTVVEDGRLDARVKFEYPGIKSSYVQVQSDSYSNRPDIKELPAREAMVEFMVRLSLQQYEGVAAPV